MTEEQLGLLAQGTTRWIERWYGSEPMKGSSIITMNHDKIAVIGGDKETHRQVRKVVMAHNAALESLDTERTRADKAEQRERELREALERISNHRYDAGGAYEMIKIARTALIQPEPDPLVEAIEAMRQTAKELRECPNRDCNLVMQAIMWEKRAADVEARLSIVKWESL